MSNRIIELDDRNKIINIRHGTSLKEDVNEIFCETGLIGQIMISDRVFENDVYCTEKDIENKISELYVKCNVEIVTTFKSDAWQGVEKSYDFDIPDQLNLLAIWAKAQFGLIDGYLYFATDEDCLPFTNDELIKLYDDGEAHKFVLIQKYKTLKEQAKACELKTQLEFVKW